VASAWVNSSNSFACCSGVMPMPVRHPRRNTSFDHLVGAGEQRRGHVKPERLCCLEVDH
jgi:hypothetical protein